jgi:hypothetical protein
LNSALGAAAPSAGLMVLYPIAIYLMIALNIRKNAAQLLKSAASAVENAKVPELDMTLPKQKIRDCRLLLAKMIMPK